MSMQKRIYDKSPILVQTLLLSGVGFQKNRTRYGEIYNRHRKFLQEFDHWSLEEQLEYQRQELVRFVKFVYEYSPFYRELYRDVDISSFQSVEDLKKLPIVDKELLRQNINRVRTIGQKDAVIQHTSGSTGKAFEVYLTKSDMMKRSAQLDHFKARLGFENLKMKKASFSGQPIVPSETKDSQYWRYNIPSKQMLYSTYHINEETLPYYVDSLNEYKPDSLDGYVSAMVQIAEYIERTGLELTFKPIAIFPTAEMVYPSARELLERVFQCKVYDQYASSEGAPFITECSHQRYHMELSSGVFEHFQDDDDEVLVTSFTTHGTPLIRYRIGDVISFEKSGVTCECGLKAPLVKEIEGRALDYLQTVDGRKLYITNVLGVFDYVPEGIIQAQFVQDSLEEVQLFLQIDSSRFKPEYEKSISESFEQMFGEATRLLVAYIDEIPKENSGKFRLLKNNIDK